MIVTQWFEPTERPVYRGVYELEGLPYPFLEWDGAAWGGATRTLDRGTDDMYMNKMPFGQEYPARCRWRGLAENPNA